MGSNITGFVIGSLLLLAGVQSIEGVVQNLLVTDIGKYDENTTMAERLAILSCQGLMNRDDPSTQVYTLRESWDQSWLDTLLEKEDLKVKHHSKEEMIYEVCEAHNFGKILYSADYTQQEVLPQIITLAGDATF